MTYTTPYVCNEQISDGLKFTLNELFFNKTLIEFIVHSVRLLLVPFVSNSVNYPSHTDHVKGPRKLVFSSILPQKRQNSATNGVFKDLG